MVRRVSLYSVTCFNPKSTKYYIIILLHKSGSQVLAENEFHIKHVKITQYQYSIK